MNCNSGERRRAFLSEFMVCKLYRSFEQGSWLRSAAERVPEEILVTEEAWALIMTEILQNLKPYLDIEQDVLIEEFFYMVTRESKESMAGYVTRKVNKNRDLVNSFCLSYTSPSPRDS